MGERQFEQSFQPEFTEIDEIYRLKNQRDDLQAELDCLSVDQEGNKSRIASLSEAIAELDAKIKKLETSMYPA